MKKTTKRLVSSILATSMLFSSILTSNVLVSAEESDVEAVAADVIETPAAVSYTEDLAVYEEEKPFEMQTGTMYIKASLEGEDGTGIETIDPSLIGSTVNVDFSLLQNPGFSSATFFVRYNPEVLQAKAGCVPKKAEFDSKNYIYFEVEDDEGTPVKTAFFTNKKIDQQIAYVPLATSEEYKDANPDGTSTAAQIGKVKLAAMVPEAYVDSNGYLKAVEGDGKLFSLTFDVIGEGSADISIEVVKFGYPPVSSDGSGQANADPIPTDNYPNKIAVGGAEETTEATTEATTKEATTEVTTKEVTTEATTKEVTTEATTKEVTTKEATTEATTKEITTEATTKEVTTKEATTEATTKEITTEATTKEVTTKEATTVTEKVTEATTQSVTQKQADNTTEGTTEGSKNVYPETPTKDGSETTTTSSRGGSSSSSASSGGGGGGGGTVRRTTTATTEAEDATEETTLAAEDSSDVATEDTTEETTQEVVNVSGLFSDLSNTPWAEEAIEALAEMGILNGVSDGEFAPQASCKRADFAIMLAKLVGLEGTASSNFDDVLPDKYYYNYVGLAKEAGLVNGYGDGKFGPEKFCTRAELMVMVANALKVLGMDITADESVLAQFSDEADIPVWARPYVAFLVENGIVNGSNGKINPNVNITRAEVAVIMFNVVNATSAVEAEAVEEAVEGIEVGEEVPAYEDTAYEDAAYTEALNTKSAEETAEDEAEKAAAEAKAEEAK